MSADEIIRTARTRAGLTQGELARRLGTTQSAIARLERSGASPRIDTLERAVAACGGRLELRLAPVASSIDATLVAEMLKLSPAERLRAFQRNYAGIRKLGLAARRG
jgi:transcriptional regulator with XRE-family HTH domain